MHIEKNRINFCFSPGYIPRGEHFIQSTWVSKRMGGDDRGDEKVKPEEEESGEFIKI